ncbi:MAG: flagellar protein FlaB, partial [Desulfobacteraceae bacterium]|nr:flagellar protein FlaB [Desulfobacteraceae bacterium]
MALTINTNTAALTAHKRLTTSAGRLAGSLEKMSSGLRINRAADDASGMVIADSLRSQALGLGQAARNAADGINMVQIADAALEESIAIIHTIRTKSIQAAQDGQTTESRAAIQADIQKLIQELDTIAKTTSFNNQKLLSGIFTQKKIHTGAFWEETTPISIDSAEASKIGHVTTAQLRLKDQEPGMVDMSIYSRETDTAFHLAPIRIAYDNTPGHGMGALADAVNRAGEQLGISATAHVAAVSGQPVASGKTSVDFAVNGVRIGRVAVQANDADGALVNAINTRTSAHGVMAATDGMGRLTLTSLDGRAIHVAPGGADTDAVLGKSPLSTAGYVSLVQEGAGRIMVNNVG